MNRVDPQRHFAMDVVRKLRMAGFVALWAGGCVRDLLLGKVPQDYDVATDARPETVQELFGKKRTRAVGAAFGVILIHGPGEAGDVEVATFRAEGPYLDGRRPQHVVFCTPEEDAYRRDFTINGMFFDPLNNEILDYVGGQQDLVHRVIRAIGNPAERFQEDKLRLLRALRFCGNLDFSMDPATAEGIRAMAREIHVVSPERITQELKRILTDPHRAITLRMAHELEILEEILPEIKPLLLEQNYSRWDQTLTRLKLLSQPSFEVAIAGLLWNLDELNSPLIRRLARRLKFSNLELQRIEWLVSQRQAFDGIRQGGLARLKKLLAAPDYPALVQILQADLQGRGAPLDDLEYCETFRQETPAEELWPLPLLSGDDLLAEGIPSGPKYKELLDRLRDAQLENQVRTRDEAWTLIRKWLSGENPATGS